MLSRNEHLERLRDEGFDVLVVGGGITGAAVARDAARRGFRTALLEARDFAAGTSSRSSRLVHGGLRYLEQFEFDLVFEASRERRRLLRIAPHLVRPLEFFFPIYADGSVGRLKLDAGMWLYHALSLFRNIERHQMLEAAEVREREPGLRAEGLLGGARYFDAQVDDARLVVSTVLSAAEAGAAVANRVEAVRVAVDDWPGHRVEVRDEETGAGWKVDALAVVLAAGPWTDELLARTGLREGADLVRPSRGAHIHLRRRRLGHERALIFESPLDGRIMFVLPWRDLTLVGTTDAFDERPPGEVTATAEDVAYLLRSVNRLFPGADLGPADVLSAWAGLRPLAASEEEGAAPGAVSRDFAVSEDPAGVFTVTGGKLTSHRAMGEATVDRVAAFLEEAGVRAERGCDTGRAPLPGGELEDPGELLQRVRARATDLGVDGEGAERLARGYGSRADAVLDLVCDDPRLGRRIVAERPHVRAEVVHAVREEMAGHVEDVAYRRTRVGLEVREAFGATCRTIAELMGRELGWDDAAVEAELERVRAIRRRDDAWLDELEEKDAWEDGCEDGDGRENG